MAADKANGDYWPTTSRGAKVVELDRGECLELLSAKKVGRLGFLSENGPQILPMNYVRVEDAVVLRTVAFGVAARDALDQRVAFEVDEVDDFLEAGWSVLIVGPARLLTDEQREQLLHGPALEPWAEGPRTVWLSVACQQVSGRRLIPV